MPRNDLPELLLSTGLRWIWESDPCYPNGNSQSPRRDWTFLETSTKEYLRADMYDWDEVDGVGRWISLVGTNSHDPLQLLDEHLLRISLADFCNTEAGPIHVVVVTPGDSQVDYVFVRHEPSAAVCRFLECVGVSPDVPEKVLPYKRLNTMRLELLQLGTDSYRCFQVWF
jgi:hypothetical protein